MLLGYDGARGESMELEHSRRRLVRVAWLAAAASTLLLPSLASAHEYRPPFLNFFGEGSSKLFSVIDNTGCSADVQVVSLDSQRIAVDPPAGSGDSVTFTVTVLPGALDAGPFSTFLSVSYQGEDAGEPTGCNEVVTGQLVPVDVEEPGGTDLVAQVDCGFGPQFVSDTADILGSFSQSLQAECLSGGLQFTSTTSTRPALGGIELPGIGSRVTITLVTDTVGAPDQVWFWQQDTSFRQVYDVEGLGGFASGALELRLDAGLEVDFAFQDDSSIGDARIGYSVQVPTATFGGFGSGQLSLDDKGGFLAFGGAGVGDTTFLGSYHFLASDTTAAVIPFEVPSGQMVVDLTLSAAVGIDTFGSSGISIEDFGFANVIADSTLTLDVVPDPGSSFVPVPIPEPAAGLRIALLVIAGLGCLRLRRS